jgi:hypothetical protein
MPQSDVEAPAGRFWCHCQRYRNRSKRDAAAAIHCWPWSSRWSGGGGLSATPDACGSVPMAPPPAPTFEGISLLLAL